MQPERLFNFQTVSSSRQNKSIKWAYRCCRYLQPFVKFVRKIDSFESSLNCSFLLAGNKKAEESRRTSAQTVARVALSLRSAI